LNVCLTLLDVRQVSLSNTDTCSYIELLYFDFLNLLLLSMFDIMFYDMSQ
jgi:hypothetical protein